MSESFPNLFSPSTLGSVTLSCTARTIIVHQYVER